MKGRRVGGANALPQLTNLALVFCYNKDVFGKGSDRRFDKQQ
jgi:hypothetical protein